MSANLAERVDPTRGMELVTGDEVDLTATRYLYFGGDTQDPARKEERPDLGAGEELGNRCLRRTGGFLPSCRITPLEFWGESLPLHLFPDGQRPLRLKGAPVENLNPNGRTLVGQPLFFAPLYPGELIVDALGMATAEKKGVVEIEVFCAVEYTEDGEVERINKLFFNDEHPRSNILRLNQERVEAVASTVLDTDVRSAAADMIKSFETFRRWAQSVIDKCHTQLDQRVAHLHTYQYSPKVRMLMEQLEVKPRGQGAAQLSDEVLKAVAGSGITPDMLEAIMTRQNENMAASIAEAVRQVLLAQPAAQKPAEG